MDMLDTVGTTSIGRNPLGPSDPRLNGVNTSPGVKSAAGSLEKRKC